MYDNTNASPTNRVTLTGRISSEPRYSHEIYGEAFYEFSLEVKRLSDMADTLPVVVSERLLLCCEVKVGKNVTVVGQLRSYNKLVEDKSRLMLNVFVRDIYDADRASPPPCKPACFPLRPAYRYSDELDARLFVQASRVPHDSLQPRNMRYSFGCEPRLQQERLHTCNRMGTQREVRQISVGGRGD